MKTSGKSIGSAMIAASDFVKPKMMSVTHTDSSMLMKNVLWT